MAELRRFANLFEIVSAEYWRENHGFRQPAPVIEWAQEYLSNPVGREPWRRTSVVAGVATGTIAGFGGRGYRLAIEAIADLLG